MRINSRFGLKTTLSLFLGKTQNKRFKLDYLVYKKDFFEKIPEISENTIFMI